MVRQVHWNGTEGGPGGVVGELVRGVKTRNLAAVLSMHAMLRNPRNAEIQQKITCYGQHSFLFTSLYTL